LTIGTAVSQPSKKLPKAIEIARYPTGSPLNNKTTPHVKRAVVKKYNMDRANFLSSLLIRIRKLYSE
jgi:hypothetical protein